MKTPEKVNFAIAALAKITCPPGKGRVYAYDSKIPGLAFCRTESGASAFYLYRRIAHRPVRLRIGGYPELTVEQARRLAAQLNVQVAGGADPQAAKRQSREESTLQDLFNDYLEKHAKIFKRERSWQEDEKLFKRYLEGWKSRRLSAITYETVEALHLKIGEDHGHYAANRTVALLSAIYNLRGRSMGYHGINPCKGIRRFKEQSRERFLQGDELPRFFQALKTHPDPTRRDLFLLLLFTGARRGNVLSMRWQDVNLDAGTWTLPAEITKNGKPLTIPLSQPAWNILKARFPARGNSPFVFPSWGDSGHLTSVKKAWRGILERAGVKDLRIHDLRRTLGSWQAAGGSSLAIIGKSLGHLNQNTTAIYARLNLEPVRQSVSAAAQAMLTAAALPPAKHAKRKSP